MPHVEPQTSFADAVREHQRMVFSLAYHFLRDPAAAEELAQDVFLKLHSNWGSFESRAHITCWLRTVTSHRCIDEARRRRLFSHVCLDDAPEPATLPQATDPLLSEQLRKIVASLPPRPRMMIILRFQEEMEPAEIAGVLGVPLGTVKSGIQRALAVLRKKMAHYQKEVVS